jgi:uncharacterized membrane-anchored protein YjiN (DUF445 family)
LAKDELVARKPEPKRLDKGLLVVLLCAAATAAGLTLRYFAPSGAAEAVFTIGMAGLIGAGTNRMAIEALFSPWPTKRFALPYTGLIERNRTNIIQGIATAVSGEILTPQALQKWMQREEVLVGIRHAACRQLEEMAAHEGPGAEVRRRLSRALHRRIEQALQSEGVYLQVRRFVQTHSGLAGRLGHATGLSDYDQLTYRILDGVNGQIGTWLVSDAGAASPMVEQALTSAADMLRRWDISNDPAIGAFAAMLVEHLDVERIVTDSLEQYSPGQIKTLLHEFSREHLAWLEVYGGLFGAVGGLILWLLS